MPTKAYGSVKEYRDALAGALTGPVTAKQLALLQSHYHSLAHTTTFSELGPRVGFKDFRGVNSQYGAFAHRVATRLNVASPRHGFWLNVLVDWPDAPGHSYDEGTLFVLRPQVVAALRQLAPPWLDRQQLPSRAAAGRPPAAHGFTSAHPYSRLEIHNVLGGSTRPYLPTVRGLVVCGCFDPKKNINAPYEIDVGDGPTIVESAEALIEQRTVIPVFLKEGGRKWRYAGDWRPRRLSRNPRELRVVKRRRPDAVSVLHMEPAFSETPADDVEMLLSAYEGDPRLRLHVVRERHPGLVAAKKVEVLAKRGELECEVCGVRASAFPKGLGDACFEVHHLTPLAAFKKHTLTLLSRLALLCANCHRMIHASKPMPTLPELRRLLRKPKPSEAPHALRARS